MMALIKAKAVLAAVHRALYGNKYADTKILTTVGLSFSVDFLFSSPFICLTVVANFPERRANFGVYREILCRKVCLF